MFQDPAVDVLALSTSKMLSKPAIRIVFDINGISHDLCPVLKLLYHVVLNLRLAFFLFILLFICDGVHIEEGHNLIFAVVDVDEFFNLSTDARNLGDIEDTWAHILVLVEQGVYKKLKVATSVLREWIHRFVDDNFLYTFNSVAIKWLLESNELVDDNSHSPDISLGVIWTTLAHLWRHEVRSTTFCLCHISFIRERF